MTVKAGHDIVEHVGRARIEYMKKHMVEFDEQICELCRHDTRGINEVFVTED